MSRPIKVINGLGYVTLTRGNVALLNEEDIPLIKDYSWYTHGHENKWCYAATMSPSPNRKTVFMHRLILGEKEGYVTDHINGNTFDNRRENLRFATHHQNSFNCKAYIRDLPKGVYRQSAGIKYYSQITYKSKAVRLGSFDTPEEAHKAYCEASKKYHGEFGKTS